jgi:hypothetical protein
MTRMPGPRAAPRERPRRGAALDERDGVDRLRADDVAGHRVERHVGVRGRADRTPDVREAVDDVGGRVRERLAGEPRLGPLRAARRAVLALRHGQRRTERREQHGAHHHGGEGGRAGEPAPRAAQAARSERA